MSTVNGMNGVNGGGSGLARRLADEALEPRRYLAALRRSWWLIALVVGVLTVGVIALSLSLPKQYQATADITVDPDISGLNTPDTDSTQRELFTLDATIVTQRVLAAAARSVGGGETADSLEDKVTTEVATDANIISVTAEDGSAAGAARIANAVASAFIGQQASIERRQLRAAQSALEEQIRRLQGTTSPASPVQQQISALQQRVAELSVSAASAGSNLQLARLARAPGAPSSPRTLRNAILALFAGLFLGVLLALGRDRLRPGISSQRELAGLLELPVLASIPHLRRNIGGSVSKTALRVEEATYQTLSAAVRLALPPTQQHVILLSSALHGEGKTTAATQLATLLAQAGHSTLLVSGDLRWPKLDEVLRVEDEPGLSDLLAASQRSGEDWTELVEGLVVEHRPRGGTELHVLPSGNQRLEAARLLAGTTVRPVFDALRQLGYSYIIVDAPPLLGIADSQVLAQQSDQLLVVGRLERLTLDTVVDLRDVLDRITVPKLGLVVVGAPMEASPYYSGIKAGPSEESFLEPSRRG